MVEQSQQTSQAKKNRGVREGNSQPTSDSYDSGAEPAYGARSTQYNSQDSEYSSDDNFQQEQRSGLFDQQKSRLLSGIDIVSSVIQNATDELRRGNGESVMAAYAEKLSHNVGDVKRWVSDLSVENCMQTTREFARRRPEVVLLGMFGAGLLVGRFIKAASVPQQTYTSDEEIKGYPTNAEVH